MPKSVEFVVIIDEGVRKRHKHETNKGRVTRFVVQLEIRVNDKWKVAVRYDCAHGYAHSDQYDINGNHTKKKLHLTFESSLTYGDWDINENWQNYRKAFLRGIKYERLQ